MHTTLVYWMITQNWSQVPYTYILSILKLISMSYLEKLDIPIPPVLILLFIPLLCPIVECCEAEQSLSKKILINILSLKVLHSVVFLNDDNNQQRKQRVQSIHYCVLTIIFLPRFSHRWIQNPNYLFLNQTRKQSCLILLSS